MDLRGASAEAVAGLVEELADKPSASLADDLFGISQAIRGEASLRRFATDASVPTQARSGLVTDLFGDKIGQDAMALVVSAVSRKWTSGLDLADGLEHLSEVAIVRSESDPGRISDELFTLAQAVQDNPGLRDALSDPVRSAADKSALIDTLLDGKALPGTIALAKQALAGTYRTVSAALAEYQKVAAAAHNQGVATVRVAAALSQAQESRLGAILASKYGRPVHLNVLIDPALVGGIKVEMGNTVIDGSVASRLDETARALAG